MPTSIRPPAVAGLFYPSDAGQLSLEISQMLAEAQPFVRPDDIVPIKALIVPHAGYMYSGPVAACAYARLAAQRDRIRRVVMFGPAHRMPFRGLATTAAKVWRTPLGDVPIDRAAIDALLIQRDLQAQIEELEPAHAQEHCLEVQLPFLQTVLANFTLVPWIVGMAPSHAVAAVLERLWGGDETLIVISSDLSHYHPYDDAQNLDRDTIGNVLKLQQIESHEQACGATPINGLVEIAQRKGLEPELLDLRNSGDTAGDRSRVVGYAAIAFTQTNGNPNHVHETRH
ncbi:MAG TPA: AmmeMemoRadiSam system protein B [Rhodocyclaceae bacterium]|nr:AmmeMemoRadiSam system protein B [Rhodocyclaceae bacterium]